MNEIRQYYSTNLKSEPVSFGKALLKGLAPDGGLFMPESIPVFTKEEIKSLSQKSYAEIAYEVAKKFFKNEIPENELLKITKSAYNFDVPLEKVYDRNYVMRLDQGPTASFKDFAARMMGRLMQYFLQKENRKILILTATSGDTGSAIANAFYGLDNIKVVILYPQKEISERQRKQMTTLQKNIQIIALNGKFDDCQAMVKKAFTDNDLDYLNLSSANSINIGRLIPQSVYYFYAFSRLTNQKDNDSIIFSVPSGNFGDLMGGLIAKNMGLPVKKFVVATNENDEVPTYFYSQIYTKIEPSLHCISSAMNVGHPSNLARLVALYGGVMDEKGNITKQPDFDKIKNDMFAISVNDTETKQMIKDAYEQHKVLFEPHGAVGWKGLSEYFRQNPQEVSPEQLSVCLETAHPAKFPQEINEILTIDPKLPPSLENLDNKKEVFLKMKNNFNDFKTFLKENY